MNDIDTIHGLETCSAEELDQVHGGIVWGLVLLGAVLIAAACGANDSREAKQPGGDTDGFC